jgi:hypothetical protein
MPKIVAVPGMGNVEFPDNMSDDAISGVIRKQVSDSVADKKTAIAKQYDNYAKNPDNASPKNDYSVGGLVQGAVGDTLAGIGNAIAHPIDTAKGIVQAQLNEAARAKKAYNNGDLASAGMHALAAVTPLVGPQAVNIGETIGSGQVSRGVGQAAVLLGSDAAGKIAGKVAGGAGDAVARVGPSKAEGLYRSALKPSTTMKPEAIDSAVRYGLDNSIPISEAGATKLQGIIDDLGARVKAQLKPGVTIDPTAVASRVDQIRGKFKNQVNPTADLNALDAAKQDFLNQHTTPAVAPKATGVLDANGEPIMTKGAPEQVNPIEASKAQDIKQNTYQQLKKKYGQLASADIEGQKALARGIKEELETQFPEIRGLNAEQAQAIGLDKVLTRAVNRIANHDPIGLLPAMAIDAGMATHGLGGATAAGILTKVMTNPAVRSRVAIALDYATRKASNSGKAVQAGTTGATRLGAITSRINDYQTALEKSSQ